jgi:hypothetical protein
MAIPPEPVGSLSSSFRQSLIPIITRPCKAQKEPIWQDGTKHTIPLDAFIAKNTGKNNFP